MKKFFKENKAFTMAEIMVVMVILSVVALFTMRIAIFQRAKYLNRYMTYAAFKVLKQGAAELKAEGCTSSDLTHLPTAYCDAAASLPNVGNTGTGRGLCERLANIYNTIGIPNCSTASAILTTTTDFSGLIPNLITTNGMKFFNLGSAADGSNLFNVYVDIDGDRRSAKLDEDVIRFTINDQSGVVLPYYTSSGATNHDYLSASVGYRDATTGIYKWDSTNVNIKVFDAYCAAYGNYPYTTCSKSAGCTTHSCDVTINEPGSLFY